MFLATTIYYKKMMPVDVLAITKVIFDTKEQAHTVVLSPRLTQRLPHTTPLPSCHRLLSDAVHSVQSRKERVQRFGGVLGLSYISGASLVLVNLCGSDELLGLCALADVRSETLLLWLAW